MGLLGDRCVRCNSIRTKKTFEGVPTCEQCMKKIKADPQQPRVCPVDSIRMTKEVFFNLIIDRCPKCKGVWLDPGELDVIRKAIENGAGGDFTTGLMLGMVLG